MKLFFLCFKYKRIHTFLRSRPHLQRKIARYVMESLQFESEVDCSKHKNKWKSWEIQTNIESLQRAGRCSSLFHKLNLCICLNIQIYGQKQKHDLQESVKWSVLSVHSFCFRASQFIGHFLIQLNNANKKAKQYNV